MLNVFRDVFNWTVIFRSPLRLGLEKINMIANFDHSKRIFFLKEKGNGPAMWKEGRVEEWDGNPIDCRHVEPYGAAVFIHFCQTDILYLLYRSASLIFSKYACLFDEATIDV